MPTDIDDVGFVSCAIKLIGVPGPKLMEDEKYTQDFIGVSHADLRHAGHRVERAAAGVELRDTPIFYFLDPRRPHILDFVMQGLWNETQTSPLEARYWSCVPYLLGDGPGDAVFGPAEDEPKRSGIPGCRRARPTIYLRDAWSRRSPRGRRFRLLIQGQTDALRMPIENAAVRWPEKLSPLRDGRDAAHSAADIRLRRRSSLSPAPVLHAVALHCRAPPARQPEPRAAPDVLRAAPPAADDEPERRTSSRPGTRVLD